MHLGGEVKLSFFPSFFSFCLKILLTVLSVVFMKINIFNKGNEVEGLVMKCTAMLQNVFILGHFLG